MFNEPSGNLSGRAKKPYIFLSKYKKNDIIPLSYEHVGDPFAKFFSLQLVALVDENKRINKSCSIERFYSSEITHPMRGYTRLSSSFDVAKYTKEAKIQIISQKPHPFVKPFGCYRSGDPSVDDEEKNSSEMLLLVVFEDDEKNQQQRSCLLVFFYFRVMASLGQYYVQ